MTNVIALRPKARVAAPETGAAALLSSFAACRRREDDVFWLKENAELLNILECTGAEVAPEALAVLRGFYDTVEDRLAFFPQYYRFLISIALDLEDLGMPGDTGVRLTERAAREDFAGAELSDLQRMEARRLLARRGQAGPADTALEDRLRAFCARSQTFALPNKKAAYELTHIVFYLSEYGRRDPGLDEKTVTSLHFAGNLAFLDQNSDLLAEICIALCYAGETPPALWTAWLTRETHLFSVEQGEGLSVADDYHDFLVCNWHAAVSGATPFRKPLAAERMRFTRSQRSAAPLRELSEALFAEGAARRPDWAAMRARMGARLSAQTLDVVDTLAGQSAHFDAFFEGFARAGRG
ncbi:hypothetical protein M4578_04630 [Salipiger sp. P9]|uniref:DUF6902 family protein n=1 Tax=Salipiger pentaromativorans TaxID=2943193 RepID=UPI0021570829|nr:hypothetical protein [Salipiger pentaromativorans]MCR8547101.1 hypothetical protein [Salipiger pentaromativorans]